ncbi:hypothetical protein HK102_010413 [Quaeritorhiza haematococci]|nr:hypothetical protein HK102_010413 [Quaeritorhiza haematococci]
MPPLFETGNARSWFGNMIQRLANVAAADVNAVEDQVIGELMWLHGSWKVEAYQTFWELKRKLDVLESMFPDRRQNFFRALELAARIDPELSETDETEPIPFALQRRSTEAKPSSIVRDPIHNNVHLRKRTPFLPKHTEKPFLFWSGALFNWYGNMMQRLATGTDEAEDEVLRELLWMHNDRNPHAFGFYPAYKDLFLLQRKVREVRVKHGSELEQLLQQIADATDVDRIPDDFGRNRRRGRRSCFAAFTTGGPETWFGKMMQRLASAGESELIAVENEVLGGLKWLHLGWPDEAYQAFWELRRKLKVLASIFDDDPQGFSETLALASEGYP